MLDTAAIVEFVQLVTRDLADVEYGRVYGSASGGIVTSAGASYGGAAFGIVSGD